MPEIFGLYGLQRTMTHTVNRLFMMFHSSYLPTTSTKTLHKDFSSQNKDNTILGNTSDVARIIYITVFLSKT